MSTKLTHYGFDTASALKGEGTAAKPLATNIVLASPYVAINPKTISITGADGADASTTVKLVLLNADGSVALEELKGGLTLAEQFKSVLTDQKKYDAAMAGAPYKVALNLNGSGTTGAGADMVTRVQFLYVVTDGKGCKC